MGARLPPFFLFSRDTTKSLFSNDRAIKATGLFSSFVSRWMRTLSSMASLATYLTYCRSWSLPNSNCIRNICGGGKIVTNSCLVVNYLFCSMQYRKLIVKELQDRRISHHLIARAVQIVQEISPCIPLRYLALQPAHENLERFYADFGFTRLHHKEWMFPKVWK